LENGEVMEQRIIALLLISLAFSGFVVPTLFSIKNPTDSLRIIDSAKKTSHLGNAQTSTLTQSGGNPALDVWERAILPENSQQHFTIIYNVTGPNGISESYARSVNASFEQAWITEIADFGFYTPPLWNISVYVLDLGASDKGITNEDCQVSIHSKIDDPDFRSQVCAHEFFHCIQLSPSYQASIAWFGDNTKDWFMEGTAEFIGSKVFPQYVGVGSFVDSANSLLDNPLRSLTFLDYSAILFWQFVVEHHGGFWAIANTMQQEASLDPVDATNETLKLLGTTFSQVFKEWTIANYFKDSSYSNGQLFNNVDRDSRMLTGGEESFAATTISWSSSYFEIIPSKTTTYVQIQVIGEKLRNLTKILIDSGRPLVSDLPLDADGYGNFYLSQANSLEKIVLVVRCLAEESTLPPNHYVVFRALPCEPKQLCQSESVSLFLAVVTGISSESSSIHNLAVVYSKSSQDSSTVNVAVPIYSSSQLGAQLSAAVTERVGTAQSAYRDLAVTNAKSIQSSSETELEISFTGTPHLLLRITPTLDVFEKGQSLTFSATVLNQMSPKQETTLALSIIGPADYSFYGFQSINVPASGVDEYSFSWRIPETAGTYIVEVGLAPSQLTAYDTVWLNVS
jgi:hypothetical protein